MHTVYIAHSDLRSDTRADDCLMQQYSQHTAADSSNYVWVCLKVYNCALLRPTAQGIQDCTGPHLPIILQLPSVGLLGQADRSTGCKEDTSGKTGPPIVGTQ